MKNSVVRVQFKDGSSPDRLFKTYAAIFRSDIADKIGAVKGSVWNIVAKTKGRYENLNVIITREPVENG